MRYREHEIHNRTSSTHLVDWGTPAPSGPESSFRLNSPTLGQCFGPFSHASEIPFVVYGLIDPAFTDRFSRSIARGQRPTFRGRERDSTDMSRPAISFAIPEGQPRRARPGGAFDVRSLSPVNTDPPGS